jgi:intracellular multiplication protein IcmL
MKRMIKLIAIAFILSASIGWAHTSLKTIPLTQPNITAVNLLVFANEAALASFSYNFVNYRKQLQEASNYFTPKAWQAFSRTLKRSGNLKAVIDKKMVVSAVAAGAPIILQQGIHNNRYGWTVQVPLLATYQNASEQKIQNLTVTMRIVRTTPFIGRSGIAVNSFIATQVRQSEENGNK